MKIQLWYTIAMRYPTHQEQTVFYQLTETLFKERDIDHLIEYMSSSQQHILEGLYHDYYCPNYSKIWTEVLTKRLGRGSGITCSLPILGIALGDVRDRAVLPAIHNFREYWDYDTKSCLSGIGLGSLWNIWLQQGTMIHDAVLSDDMRFVKAFDQMRRGPHNKMWNEIYQTIRYNVSHASRDAIIHGQWSASNMLYTAEQKEHVLTLLHHAKEMDDIVVIGTAVDMVASILTGSESVSAEVVLHI